MRSTHQSETREITIPSDCLIGASVNLFLLLLHPHHHLLRRPPNPITPLSHQHISPALLLLRLSFSGFFRVRVLGVLQSAMAVSSSLAASFSTAKLETPLFLNSVSSSRSSSQYRIFCKPARSRRYLSQRRAYFIPRCEVASDALVEADSARSSSVSALEQLKTSAADSWFSFFLLFFFLVKSVVLGVFSPFPYLYECDCESLVVRFPKLF